MFESEVKAVEQDMGRGMAFSGVVNGVLSVIPTNLDPYFFVEKDMEIEGCKVEDCDLKSVDGKKVWKASTFNPYQVGKMRRVLERKGVRTYEADIPYVRRVFTDEVFGVNYDSRVVFLDTEYSDVGGFARPGKSEMIAYTCAAPNWGSRMVTRTKFDTDSEMELVAGLLGLLSRAAKTVIVGWNVSFDIDALRERARTLHIRDGWLDYCYGYDLRQPYKFAVKGLSSYSLAEVARFEGIGEKKREKPFSELNEKELTEYNRNDVALLMEIEKKYGFVQNDIASMEEAGLPLSMNTRYQLGDTLVLRRLRQLGYVAPNSKRVEHKQYSGAFVKEPIPGIYRNVAVFDVESLYPNVVIAARIDVDGFHGEVVPHLLERFMEEKKRAEREGDSVRRSIYKLWANSMYGLFAYPKYRFYDPSKAELVTSKGREIIKKLMSLVEDIGLQPIYGDTDSVFVEVSGNGEGLKRLEEYLNTNIAPFRVKLDKFFSKLIIFGKEGSGAKKRYAGIDDSGKLNVRGIELRRSDWCDLAKIVLRRALNIVFESDDPVVAVKSIRSMLKEVRQKLFSGEYDSALVITKSVRREYKVKTPQGEAYQQALERGIATEDSAEVSYYIGAGRKVVAVSDPGEVSAPDYRWYWERQILPPIRRLLKSIESRSIQRVLV